MYIDTRDTETTKDLFDKLFLKKQQIEEAVGKTLEWDRLDSSRATRISLYFPSDITIDEEERWPEAREWLIDTMNKMRDAFAPELDALVD